MLDMGVASAVAATLSEVGTPESLTGITLTSTGMSLGTPAYMSPEQALGARELDGRSDQYAVGCVLYEMLAGAPPYTGASARALIGQHVTAPVPNIRALRPEVPPAVSLVLAKAMAKTPEARFASAAEFASALEHAAPASIKSALAPYLSRRRLLVGAVAFLAAAALGLGALLRYQGSAPSLNDHLVAVAPFEVIVPGLAAWRDEMVGVLSRDLDGVVSLHAVPPTTVLGRWQGRADLPGALALGRRTGARLVVYGGVFRSGSDSVRVSATVLDVARERPLRELDVRGAVAQMDHLVDSLAIGLLRELGGARSVDVAQPAALGAHSLPALKAYPERRAPLPAGRLGLGSGLRRAGREARPKLRPGQSAVGTGDPGAGERLGGCQVRGACGGAQPRAGTARQPARPRRFDLSVAGEGWLQPGRLSRELAPRGAALPDPAGNGVALPRGPRGMVRAGAGAVPSGRLARTHRGLAGERSRPSRVR